MKTLFVIVYLLLFYSLLYGQQGKKVPKPAQPVTQSDITKMMEDAMKGMNESEKGEIKKALGEAQKIANHVQQTGMGITYGTMNAPTIPSKQTALLNKIPTLKSTLEFNNFINARLLDCKKKIAATTIKQVDDYISTNANNAVLVNIATFLLMQKKTQAALYAALKLVTLKPDNIMLKNNLGVLLHQTGYAAMAIPIFQYVLTTYNYSEILNNKAQCYLSLGDKENAKKMFMACLAKNTNNAKALCGMGLLSIAEGNLAEATLYITKSLKNEYSETAEALANKHKMKIPFDDIKPLVADYFNPQKYKPVPPATSVYEVENTQMKRDQFNELAINWQIKAKALSAAQNNKKDSESVAQLINKNIGFVLKTPLSKKAKFILEQLTADYYDYNKHNYRMDYENRANELYKNLEDKMEAINKEAFDNRYDDCQKKITVVNSYLSLSAENHKAYQGKTVYKLYDWVNQNLQWKRYLLNSSEYKQQMYELINDYFRVANGYNVAQIIYPIPTYIADQCKDEKPAALEEIPADSLKVEEKDCPLKITIPFGVGKAKFGCNGYEIEGGEGIVGGIEKNYTTGEMTIFVGLGFEAFAEGFGIGGIEGGGKAGSFVTIGEGFTVIDCGNKAELGVEGGVGPFVSEVKLTGTMGMESGINVEQDILGNNVKIFEYGTSN